MPSPGDTVLQFIRAVNRHETASMTNLITRDHEFVDSLGVAERGADRMRQAWIAYFFMVPDYAIEIAQVFERGTSVVVTGKASGTVAVRGELLPANRWELPMAVLAEVRDGLVARWQVFADNDPVRQILNRT
jgi:ketosteroid isomerase-like protein